MSDPGFRTESDSLGPVQVPATALHGAQTQRAVENFPVSGLRLPRRLIRALALIKEAAAQENKAAGTLSSSSTAVCRTTGCGCRTSRHSQPTTG